MAANSKGPRADATDSRKPNTDTDESVVTGELPKDLTVQETLDWVAGDSIYGVSGIEVMLRRAGKGYVLGPPTRSLAGWTKELAAALRGRGD